MADDGARIRELMRGMDRIGEMTPAELVREYQRGAISRRQLFDHLALHREARTPEALAHVLPPELRSEFIEWTEDFGHPGRLFPIIPAADYVRYYLEGQVTREELFLSVASLAEVHPPDSLVLELPPELRAEFRSWALEYATDESGLVFSSAGFRRFPRKAMAALRAWRDVELRRR